LRVVVEFQLSRASVRETPRRLAFMKRLALLTSILIAVALRRFAQASSYHLWGSKKILYLVWYFRPRSANIHTGRRDESSIWPKAEWPTGFRGGASMRRVSTIAGLLLICAGLFGQEPPEKSTAGASQSSAAHQHEPTRCDLKTIGHLLPVFHEFCTPNWASYLRRFPLRSVSPCQPVVTFPIIR
jgi:hypothetical protein